MKQLPIFEDGAPPLKRYYTIGEVAEMFDISKSLIRFWESEFDYLKPHKNSKGDRRFTVQNIEQLQFIYELVKERGFTIEGARQEIPRLHSRQVEKQKYIARLQAVKEGLSKLKEQVQDK